MERETAPGSTHRPLSWTDYGMLVCIAIYGLVIQSCNTTTYREMQSTVDHAEAAIRETDKSLTQQRRTLENLGNRVGAIR